jgi:hypothetical protein
MIAMISLPRWLCLVTLAAFLFWGPAAPLLQAAGPDSLAAAQDAVQDSSDEEGDMDLLIPDAPRPQVLGQVHESGYAVRLPDAFVPAPDDPPNR